MSLKSTAFRLRTEGRLEGKAEGKAEGMAVGKAEGEVSGRADLLCRMLQARFREVPAAVRTRVDLATREQIDGWAIRCLTARSLDQVFAND